MPCHSCNSMAKDGGGMSQTGISMLITHSMGKNKLLANYIIRLPHTHNSFLTRVYKKWFRVVNSNLHFPQGCFYVSSFLFSFTDDVNIRVGTVA